MATTIGFLGLGQMGRPMACNLAEAGHDLLAYDRSSEALAAVAGKQRISAGRDLRSLAEACDTLILMLPDSRIVDGVLWGDDGLAACLRPGALLIDMGSSDPNRTRENHRRLAEQGVALVDAPVSGGVKRAIDASLSIMAGGDEADFDRARPIFDKLGRTILHVGPAGAGHALKALNNYVSASGLLAVCEALVAAQRFGIDPETANALFNTSTGRNNTTDVKVEQFMLSGRFDAGFAMALMRKDLETARSLMHSLGSAHDFVDACARLWNEAEKTLPAGADHTAMYTFVQQR